MSKTTGTVRFFLKAPNGDKPSPIRAVFSYAYTQFIHYEKKLSIHPKGWNKEKQRVKQSREFSGYAEFNAALDDIENCIPKVYRRFKQENDNREPSLLQLRELVNIERGKTEDNRDKSINLYSFIEEFLEKSHNRINSNTGKFITPSTITAYTQTFRILKEFGKYKSRKFDFEDITTDFYNEFTKFMTNKSELRLNTIGKHQRNIKTYMKEAFERKLTDNRDFMSRTFKVTSEKVDDVYLDEAEIDLLQQLDLATNKKLSRVRDLFVLGCNTGLRFSDLSKLTRDNIIEQKGKFDLVVSTQKTDAKVKIPLLKNSMQIIDKYLEETGDPFPKAYSNQKMNQYLKEVCQMIPEFHKDFVTTNFIKGKKTTVKTPKYANISTHTARRSFATNMLRRGLPTALIMKITGHSSEKSFARYIKINENDFADMFRERMENNSN